MYAVSLQNFRFSISEMKLLFFIPGAKDVMGINEKEAFQQEEPKGASQTKEPIYNMRQGIRIKP